MTTDAPPLRLAATIIIARDGAEGVEVFMVKRHGKSSFMANAYVYPGGALDEADQGDEVARHLTGRAPAACAARLGMDPDDPVQRARATGIWLAGVRETFEEAGILLAHRPERAALIDLTTDPDTAARFGDWRRRLHDGQASVAAMLSAEDLSVPLDRLELFARWITPTFERKRFDTYFFVARAPRAQRPIHDAQETTASCWVRPADALAHAAAGEWLLAPPTVATLHQVSRHATTEALLAYAARLTPPVLIPHLDREAEGGPALLMPGDPDYPVDDPALALATPNDEPWTRMVMGEHGAWRFG